MGRNKGCLQNYQNTFRIYYEQNICEFKARANFKLITRYVHTFHHLAGYPLDSCSIDMVFAELEQHVKSEIKVHLHFF